MTRSLLTAGLILLIIIPGSYLLQGDSKASIPIGRTRPKTLSKDRLHVRTRSLDL